MGLLYLYIWVTWRFSLFANGCYWYDLDFIGNSPKWGYVNFPPLTVMRIYFLIYQKSHVFCELSAGWYWPKQWMVPDHPVAYTSGLFRGSQLNWSALTKEDYAIYMAVKKLNFYLDSAKITLWSNHLPLKKFMKKNTINAKINNWVVELESQTLTLNFLQVSRMC